MIRSTPWAPMLLTWVAGTSAQQQMEPVLLKECALELRATWEPLTDTVYHFERRYPLVRDLAPRVAQASYHTADFQPLLPDHRVAVGDTWRIEVDHVLPFLRQFHPGATAQMHHDNGFGVSAPGGWACLRSLDQDHAEVVLRVHADFLLEGDGDRSRSSWYTPAQFRGRLVIDRRRAEVVALEWRVPSQSANVDVNIAENGSVSADIGRIPVMESTGGSVPTFAADAEQISEDEADDALARLFYPFATIDWLDLAAARAESRASGKPLHVIALFGSLLDESC